jgi:Kef-type K+ transport system membrane component KefB
MLGSMRKGDAMSNERSAKFDHVVRGRNLTVLAVSDIVLFLIANIAYGGGNQHGLRNNVSNVAWAAFLIGFLLLILFGIAYLAQVIRRRAKAHA